MIEHLVLLRFNPETPTATKDRVVSELQALKSMIPSVIDLTAGHNFADRNRGYDIGLVVRLRDREGLNAYQDHPEHQRVVKEWIKPNVEQVLALDYEFAQ